MSKRKFILGSMVVVAVIGFSRHFWLPPVAGWLNVSEPRFPVDYAIPLPGGNDTRPFAVAALVRSGMAKKTAVLVNPQTSDEADGVVMPMHEVTRRVLLLRGVAEEDILLLDGTSTSTFSDIQIIGRLFDHKPNATIAVVTSPAHTRRARWVIRHLLPDQQICVVAALEDSYDQQTWWQSRRGVQWTVSEYLKLLFYVVRYSSAKQIVVTLAFIAVGLMLVTKVFRKGRSAQTSPISGDAV